MTIARSFLVGAGALTFAAAAQAQTPTLLPSAPSTERCTAAPATTGSASAWLDRAVARVIPSNLDKKVLFYHATHDQPLWEQSDRPYEPYIPNMAETLRWYDPNTGVEGRQSIARVPTPVQYPSQLFAATASFVGRDTLLTPVPGFQPFGATYRRLNPWIVLLDWRAHASDVHVLAAKRCIYHDYPRIVLTRGGERLYLSESDGVPIKPTQRDGAALLPLDR